MADVKISGLPSDSSLDGNHYVPLNDPSGPTTKRTLLSTLAAFFFSQTNIPDGSGSPRTRMTEMMYDFVASGMVWSGDAYASTRNASMTSGIVYINGRRISISSVSARSFTASKDTYIDILDNADGTGTLVYTEVTNNAASPALAANSIRIGIIVTGASNIAAVGSVNQGGEDKVLPIASSIPYQVADSLGNLICNRDPNKKLLSRRHAAGSDQSAITTVQDVTGVTVVVVTDGLRKLKLSASAQIFSSVTGDVAGFYMKEGASVIKSARFALTQATSVQANTIQTLTPTAGTHTYKMTIERVTGTGNLLLENTVNPAQLTAELE